MNINSIVLNTYIISLVGGVFSFFFIFFFLEKVEQRMNELRNKHDAELIKKYHKSPATIKSVIEMFDSLKINRSKYDKIKDIVNAAYIFGVMYLVGCILGFILQSANIKEDLAIVLIILGGGLFILLLVVLIFWYRWNKI